MKSKVTRNEIIFQGTFNLLWHLRAWTFNRNKQGPFVWEFKYLIPRKTGAIFQIVIIILDLISKRERLWAGIIKKSNRTSNDKLAVCWKALHNHRASSSRGWPGWGSGDRGSPAHSADHQFHSHRQIRPSGRFPFLLSFHSGHEFFAAKSAKPAGALSHASESSLSPSFSLWFPSVAKPGTQGQSI